MSELPDARVAVVTGGASGIGRAVVDAFVAAGNRVAVIDRARGRDAAPPGVLALQADVGDERSVDEAFAQVVAQVGPVDVLVNSAGIDVVTALVDTSLADWERVQRVNATGVFLCTRAAARIMLPRRSGSIVSVSSINAQLGWHKRTAYAASKGAIDAFTRAAAAELGPFGIRVNAVAPGAVDTPIWAGTLTDEARAAAVARAPLRVLGRPPDIADVIVFLASDAARFVTGAVVPVCGGRSTSDYIPGGAGGVDGSAAASASTP